MKNKTVIAKKWDFLTEFLPDEIPPKRLPGVQFAKLFPEMKASNVKFLKITFEEIVDWDRAPMRKYIHAATYPAFAKKYNDSQSDDQRHHFHVAEVKRFLKAKFIGFYKDANYYKWEKPLMLDRAINDMAYWLALDEKISGLMDKIDMFHTEDLTPEEYWLFIHKCDDYYFELFQEMFDTTDRPEKPDPEND